MDISRPHVSTTLSVPAYTAADPELWFARLQLFFQHQRIQDEATMFELALGAMPEDSLSQLRDFILTAHSQPAPFTALKSTCLQRLVDNAEQRIRQALTGEELADRMPSAFLRRLQQLLPSSQVEREDAVLRQLFLTRLPQQLQAALLPFNDKSLSELASLADRMLALQAPPPAGTAHGLQDTNHRLDRIEQMIEQLTVMFDNTRRIPRSPSPARRHRSKRSPSPSIESTDESKLCFYHRRFGDRARKCTPPCQAGNDHGARR
uniref:DUF7041 domain-containing protein n=1 Tax=Trichuris muris TaxID=70415 RepID=A0A5S6Q679_TRIMR